MTESPDKSSDTPSRHPTAGAPETGWSTPPWPPVVDGPPPPYPYPVGPYPGPPPYYGYGAPPARPRNGLGITSLVIAIAALAFVWSVLGGVVLGVAAAAIGVAARARVKRGEADNGGVAVAGIVLGSLAVVVSLIFIAIWMGFWREVGGDDYMACLEKAGSDRARQQQCADRFRQQVENQFSVTLTPQPPRQSAHPTPPTS